MDWIDGPVMAGRSVLVTGAGGFIGSRLTERLVELGAEVDPTGPAAGFLPPPPTTTTTTAPATPDGAEAGIAPTSTP